MFAQIAEVEKTFAETAKTFGLSVTILIAVVLALAFVLWMVVKTATRWLKPLVEDFFKAHVSTMLVVREQSTRQADSMERMSNATTEIVDSQKAVAALLVTDTAAKGEQLDALKNATDRTNQILETSGKCQVETLKSLITELVRKNDAA